MSCQWKISLHLHAFILLILLLPVNEVVSANKSLSSVDFRPDLVQEKKQISESGTVIKDVKSKEPFINIQQERVWNYKESEKDSEQISDESDETEDVPDLGWINSFVNALSVIIEFALWLLPLLIAYYLYKHRAYWLSMINNQRPVKKSTLLPDTLFGLDVRRDQLPDDIEQSAQALWLKNKKREAVSLLYRGALVSLFDNERYALPAGATEQDCIRYLELQNDAANITESNDNHVAQKIMHRFTRITDIWVSIAYAHKLPAEEKFQEICVDWNLMFIADAKAD